jgi:hypothetical protein
MSQDKKMCLKTAVIEGPRGRVSTVVPNCLGSELLFRVMLKPIMQIQDLILPDNLPLLGAFCKHYDIDLVFNSGETKPLADTLKALGINYEFSKSGDLKLIY